MLKADWISRGGPPKNQPDPNYPDGISIDLAGNSPGCTIELQHPAPYGVIGGWFITCDICNTTAYITAASRIDDPSSVKLPCKLKGQA